MDDETRTLFIQQRLNLLSAERRLRLNPAFKKEISSGVRKYDENKIQSYRLTKLAEIVQANNFHRIKTRKMTMAAVESTSNSRKSDADDIQSKSGALAPKCGKCSRQLVTSQKGEISLTNFNPNQDHFVAKELVNRLTTENLLYATKSANRKKIHDPKSCKKCIRTEEKLARYEFLKRNMTRVESSNLDRKIDDIVHTTDTIFMIGDLAATLPKHSDDPDDIWKKLLHNSGV